MPEPDPDRLALAAGFVTATLSAAEAATAEALIASDEDFAIVVKAFQETFEAEGDAALPETVWQGIQSRLTHRQT